jgi:hypothetical protein
MKAFLSITSFVIGFILLLTCVILGCKKNATSPGSSSPSHSSGATTGGTTTGNTSGCPTTAACGCSGKKKAECESSPCCKWTVGSGCGCL